MKKLTGHGQPHKHLPGKVGQYYEDLNTRDIYECLIAQPYSPTHGWPVGGYIWDKVLDGDDIELTQEVVGGGDDGSLKALIERTVTEITLPSDLTKIGYAAFSDCTNLALTSLPDGVTSIDFAAFNGCTNLALTSLPTGLTIIYDTAFSGCTNLALTSLPEGLKTINQSAFNGCTNITSISLPSSLTYVGEYVFQNCSNLGEVTFNGKPNYTSRNVFSSCTNLRTINVPWAEGAVANAPWGATNATINYNYTGG